MSTIWAIIKQKRLEHGISQAALTKRLNIRVENIRKQAKKLINAEVRIPDPYPFCHIILEGIKTLAKVYSDVRILGFKFHTDVTTYYFSILRRKL